MKKVKSMYFIINDHPINYSDEGKGTPIILLHAFAADHVLWEPQVRTLSLQYRVIALDLRGFGASGETDGTAIFVDQYADDVIALLNKLGIEKAVIGGISLGGYVALSLAQRYPQSMLGLILCNTRAGADSEPAKAARVSLVQKIEQYGSAAVVEFYGDKLFGPKMSTQAKTSVRNMMLRQRPQSLISALLGMAQRPDRSPILDNIGLPTLIISGTADTLIPSSESLFMHRHIRDSAFVDIPDAGHLSNIDKPEEFNRAVNDFMGHLA